MFLNKKMVALGMQSNNSTGLLIFHLFVVTSWIDGVVDHLRLGVTFSLVVSPAYIMHSTARVNN